MKNEPTPTKDLVLLINARVPESWTEREIAERVTTAIEEHVWAIVGDVTVQTDNELTRLRAINAELADVLKRLREYNVIYHRDSMDIDSYAEEEIDAAIGKAINHSSE